MQYEIISNYHKNDSLRKLFNELSVKTFGLDFENWYQSGYWNDKYIPYSVLADGKIISNVSVNIIACTVCGRERHYIQLGTIMTDEEYRNRGFSRILMEKVISDHHDCDGIFLYANDSVTDFYPKFGFRKADEFRFRTSVSAGTDAGVKQIPMNDSSDFAEFINAKKALVSRSPVITDTDDLTMFYLTQFMRECVYKLSDRNCYVIAEKDGDTLTVYDILSDGPIDPKEICSLFGSEIKNAEFAFIPENSSSLEKYQYQEEDTTFFVMGETLIADLPDIMSFPALVHA